MIQRHVVLFSDVRGAGGQTDVGYVPLSLLTIASYLKSRGVSARVIDAQFDTNWHTTLRDALADALYLGVTAFTGPSLASALTAVRLARTEFPGLPIVWGGYHATQAHSALLCERLADFVVIGPGEYAALEIAERISDSASKRLQGLADVAHLQDGEVVLTRGRSPVDPADLPPVDYSFIDLEPYFAVNGRALSYISSYGCPYACTFCAEPNQTLRKWSGRSPRQIVDDIALLRRAHSPRRIDFSDPNFSSSARRVIEFVELAIEEGMDVDKSCDMRATDVLRIAQSMTLAQLQRAGFVTVYLGAESGSDAILKGVGKKVCASEISDACQLLDEAGITTIVSFMHDLPTETADDSRMTFELIERLIMLPHNVQRHHFFTPYPATQMYDSSAVRKKVLSRRPTQTDWSSSSTYGASRVWAGRPEFRARCFEHLVRIQARLPDPNRFTLPTLSG